MKTKIKEQLEKIGVSVKRISFFDGHTPIYKVSIDWKDYLKVRDLPESSDYKLKFCF